MRALSLLPRNSRHSVLCNLTDHAVQLARLTGVGERPFGIELFAELPVADDAAIAAWIENACPERPGGYVPAYCAFHPAERMIVRENINTKRLAEANYLETLLAEHAKTSALRDWRVFAVQPADGDEITPAMSSRPGLLLGLPRTTIRETQQRLTKLGLLPRRLEIGTLTLLGALTRHLRESAYPNAVVACEIGLTQTRIYFIGKDGVHTPAPLPHGLRSIDEAAMKELGVPDVVTARAQLITPTAELRGHGRRLVRMLTRHLKPAVDYFEMQTGQPIGAIFCSHLPAKLGWLEEALAAAVELQFLVPDGTSWLGTMGMKLGHDTLPPDRTWFQAISLVGQLAPLAPHEAKS